MELMEINKKKLAIKMNPVITIKTLLIKNIIKFLTFKFFILKKVFYN
jgi:hypothetical protein